MKTLTQFKKDLRINDVIELLEIKESNYNDKSNTLVSKELNMRMKGARVVTHIDTTGFYLKGEFDINVRGSFCGYPKAKNLEYKDDDTFTITEKDEDTGRIWQVRKYKRLINSDDIPF